MVGVISLRPAEESVGKPVHFPTSARAKDILATVFRGKFYDGLKSLFRRRQLAFRGSLAWLAEARAFARFLARAASPHLDR